jgi:hypothetical protein
MPEEPVVVSGGSVTIEFSDKFTAGASSGGGKNQHKHSGGRLRRVMVNGQKVADLNEHDRVEIIYED